MSWWSDLLKSPARRKAEQDRARRRALTKARTALRRERRELMKQQAKSDALRQEAVACERSGKPALAKQKVRHFLKLDRESMARNLALDNMEYALGQAGAKDNYEEFLRAMQVVANIEELAQEGVDPDEVRERLASLRDRNQDLIEPWMQSEAAVDSLSAAEIALSPEEDEAYAQVISDAAAAIRSTSSGESSPLFAEMDRELERKMDEALAKG